MKLLVFWDIFGRIWRQALAENLDELKAKYSPDFVIANGENMTAGKWPILKHIKELREIWIDLFTGGNHTLTNLKDIGDYLDGHDSRMIRPANYYETDEFKLPGKGYRTLEKDGKKILVINLLSGVFMADSVYNPFLKVDEILKEFEWEKLDWIIVDFHRETTSESQWMGFYLDGRASLVFGTHTHTQTNDDRILKNGTGFISDVWFCGPLNSIIGADFESLKKRFVTWVMRWRIEQKLENAYRINWVFVEIEEWKCVKIEKIRIEKEEA